MSTQNGHNVLSGKQRNNDYFFVIPKINMTCSQLVDVALSNCHGIAWAVQWGTTRNITVTLQLRAANFTQCGRKPEAQFTHDAEANCLLVLVSCENTPIGNNVPIICMVSSDKTPKLWFISNPLPKSVASRAESSIFSFVYISHCGSLL